MHRIVADAAVGNAAALDVPGDRRRRVETPTELAPGDVAVRAAAYAVVLLPELWGAHCHTCFGAAERQRLRRCGRCRTVSYCTSWMDRLMARGGGVDQFRKVADCQS